AMITLPLWGPESESARILVLACISFAFWVTAGWGGNAWFSWMRDIVPEQYRGRYWGYRSTLMTVISAFWGFAAGYTLERLGLDLNAFKIIYGIGVFFGVADIVCFVGVYHPKMLIKRGEAADFTKMVEAAAHPGFLKFTGVMAILWFTGSLESLTGYHLMRAIGMEIFNIQTLVLFGTLTHLVFSLLWGHFIDHYGTKAAFNVTMFGAILPPLIVTLTPLLGETALYAAAAVGNIMGAGLALAGTNMLFSLSKKEDQAMTMATYSVFAGIVMATGYAVCENLLYPGFRWAGNRMGMGPLFYAVLIYVTIALMRVVSGILSMRLPEIEKKPVAWITVRLFYTTNPFRAFYSMGRFLVVKSSRLVGKKDYENLHPSARWRID
ncbi:MAG TPA: MFS transporter, partial [Planctomycetes bacterium]|nr:MFS transporter [Planctomycetota bacterium]